MPDAIISDRVGRPDLGAVNKTEDVILVKYLLTEAARILKAPELDPDAAVPADPKDALRGMLIGEQILAAGTRFLSGGGFAPAGLIDQSPGPLAGLIRAMGAFQMKLGQQPSGVFYPGGKSITKLNMVATTGNVNLGDSPYFPLAAPPKKPWTEGMLRFAANRGGGTRAHAGCDLYANQGTLIHAIQDGKVLELGDFYLQTWALVVDHGTFIARYGEIQKAALVKKGQTIYAGQQIAKVGHLVPPPTSSDMLHLELYNKGAAGPLTVSAANSKKRADSVPFLRRIDLMDPTDLLNRWSANKPKDY